MYAEDIGGGGRALRTPDILRMIKCVEFGNIRGNTVHAIIKNRMSVNISN